MIRNDKMSKDLNREGEEVLKPAFSRGYKKVVHIQYFLYILAQFIIDFMKRNVIYIG